MEEQRNIAVLDKNNQFKILANLLEKYSLKSKSHKLKNWYISAIKLLEENDIPCKLMLAGHSIREIMKYLPGEITLQEVAKHDSASTDRIRELRSIWSEDIQHMQVNDDANLEFAVTPNINKFLNKWHVFYMVGEAHKEANIQFIRNMICRLFYDQECYNNHFINEKIYKWREIEEYMISVAHGGQDDLDVFEQKLNDFNRLLDDILQQHVLNNMKELDAIVNSLSTRIDVKMVETALSKCTTPILHDYFFNNLQSALWIKPLKEHSPDIFKNPPPAEISDDGRVYYPNWAEATYIASVADQDPEAVEDIIKNLNPTNNHRIYENLTDAFLKMDVQYVKPFVNILINWLQLNNQGILAEKAARIALHFAKNNEKKSAQNIMRAALTIKVEYINGEVIASSDVFIAQYEQIINRTIPEFVKCLHEGGVRILEDILITYLGNCNQKKIILQNFSLYKPTVIEIFEQSIVKSYVDLLKLHPQYLSNIIDRLLKSSYDIFNLIAIKILAEIEINNIDIFCRVFLERRYYENYKFLPSLLKLFENKFKCLDDQSQVGVLDFIFNLNLTNNGSSERVKYSVLKLLEPYLDNPRKELLNELNKRYSDGYMIEPESTPPINRNTLIAMSSKEIFDLFLSESTREPWLEDISYELQDVLREEPNKLLYDQRLVSLPLILLKSVIYALNDTPKKIDWDKTIELCIFVASSNHNSDGTMYVSGEKLEARRVVLRLLVKGLSNKGIKIESRNDVWSIINKLSYQENDIELKDIGTSDDLYHIAINNTASYAIEAAIVYGVWIKNSSICEQGTDLFSTAPELLELLNNCLNDNTNYGILKLAILGAGVSYLHAFDKTWFKTIIGKIFLPENSDVIRHNGAWTAYLRYSNLYLNVARDLHQIYQFYVDNIDSNDRKIAVNRSDQLVRLGEHVITLYFYGIFGDNPENCLISHYFACAPFYACFQAMSNMGLLLLNTKGIVDEKSIERLKSLWDFLKENFNNDNKLIFSSLGWWIASNKFDFDWSIQQLFWLFSNDVNIDVDYRVCEWMMIHADQKRNDILRILIPFIKNVFRIPSIRTVRWEIMALIEPIKYSIDNEQDKILFNEIVNELVKKGFFEFRKLI